jgi:hypothetical protein
MSWKVPFIAGSPSYQPARSETASVQGFRRCKALFEKVIFPGWFQNRADLSVDNPWTLDVDWTKLQRFAKTRLLCW